MFDGLVIGPKVEGEAPPPATRPALRPKAPSLKSRPTDKDILDAIQQHGAMDTRKLCYVMGIPGDQKSRALLGWRVRKLAKNGLLEIVPSDRKSQHVYTLVNKG